MLYRENKRALSLNLVCKFYISIMFLFIISWMACISTASEKTAYQHNEEGLKELKSGNFKDAIEELKNAKHLIEMHITALEAG